MIPKVNNLREAVQFVIKNNTDIGYSPTYFIRETSCSDRALPGQCIKLVHSPNALNAVYMALEKHPDMVTLEDFVVRYGEEWGLPAETISKAKESVTTFNERWPSTRPTGGEKHEESLHGKDCFGLSSLF